MDIFELNKEYRAAIARKDWEEAARLADAIEAEESHQATEGHGND